MHGGFCDPRLSPRRPLFSLLPHWLPPCRLNGSYPSQACCPGAGGPSRTVLPLTPPLPPLLPSPPYRLNGSSPSRLDTQALADQVHSLSELNPVADTATSPLLDGRYGCVRRRRGGARDRAGAGAGRGAGMGAGAGRGRSTPKAVAGYTHCTAAGDLAGLVLPMQLYLTATMFIHIV